MAKAASGADGRLDIGEVYGEAFGLIADHWRPLGLIAFLLGAAPQMVVALVSMAKHAIPLLGIVSFLVPLAALVAVLVMRGALIYFGVQALGGSPPSLQESVRMGWKVWLPLLGLSILTALGVLAGLVLLVVPGIILGARWAVGGPLLVVEGRGVMDSMGRSAVLTTGNRLNIFLLYLMFVIVALLLDAVLIFAFGGFSGLAGVAADGPEWIQRKFGVLNGIVAPVLTILFYVIGAAVQSALFRQLRALHGSGAPDALAQASA